MFFFIYSICTTFMYLLLLPLFSLFSFKSKYKESIPARFFLWKNRPLKPNGIWFHSCSFGEAKAIKPLVDALPKEVLRMTTTTQTGRGVVDCYTRQSCYLPFEPLLLGWLRPQKVLVVMEAEFWYLLFMLAKRRGARTFLINARMSDHSFLKYQKMAWLYRQIFKHIDVVYAQTRTDKIRLESLGAHHVVVMGNIKLASLPKPTKQLPKPKTLVVCAASTHEGEERLILEAFAALKKEQSDAKLIIVPRHPERFKKVVQLVDSFVEQYGLLYHCYTEKESVESDITVIDMLGELVNIYAISDVVILGGAFEPIGGHNAAEAAQFGCRIISGPHYFNQKDIFEAVEGIAIVEPTNLSKRLVQYKLLKPAKVRTNVDVLPLVEELKSVLSYE
ncbi:MAG: lipid IV(A) 3-deoxy-D-manno-octulosonic acid transferase [Sulfurovum sp.]|nr:lipid IV(A) 3-deoxy-D-manno-octulosonic acid transferase [Sulfurovum sp.]MCB4745016.1 lipid IV(A) 3-deoxy-D-manno-octulosonic acid transferase [Sulfurovum sp.]MCB4746538.1 lipid IV(A) 3-deoxy-D-manno-octulosonic acid transferase [Sulfurovum sp.]MCB4747238.1 lipid IV(A) 3-deoxy-D-manno-octulosonic acid transferase [Sulfurovum sp.]MCB4748815.1 lipid IV(A) 3-deoxy-D-manno-octulosonic acid transferase [Sulfurovum sp.]